MEAELQKLFKERKWNYVDIKNETDMKMIYKLFIHNDKDVNVEELTPLGLNYVGFYHEKITKNYGEMKKYYLMAIENGNSLAMNNLGWYHQNITKNYGEMEKYYLMAIENGNSQTMYNLYSFYTDNFNAFDNFINKVHKQEKELKEENEALKEENEELKYRPGGPGMLDTQLDFESRLTKGKMG